MIRRNLQTENQSYNYWKVQIHRNKIEWVNTILIIEGKNTFCLSPKTFFLKDNNKMHIGLVIRNEPPRIYEFIIKGKNNQ